MYVATLQQSANVVEAMKYYKQKCTVPKYFYSNIPMWFFPSVQIRTYGNTHKLVYYNISWAKLSLSDTEEKTQKEKKKRSSDISSTLVRSRPKNHLNLHVHPFHPQNIHFRVVVHFPREKTESQTTFNLSISLHELHLSTAVSESPTYLEFLILKAQEKLSL